MGWLTRIIRGDLMNKSTLLTLSALSLAVAAPAFAEPVYPLDTGVTRQPA